MIGGMGKADEAYAFVKNRLKNWKSAIWHTVRFPVRPLCQNAQKKGNETGPGSGDSARAPRYSSCPPSVFPSS